MEEEIAFHKQKIEELEKLLNSSEFKKLKDEYNNRQEKYDKLNELEKKYTKELEEIDAEIEEIKKQKKYYQLKDKLSNVKKQLPKKLTTNDLCWCPATYKFVRNNYLTCSICGHKHFDI